MPTDLMIIAGGPKGTKPNPFAKGKGKTMPGGLESPDPIGGRLKGRAALEEAGYHGGDQTCSTCQNLKEPDVCRKHMAKVDPDFGHCNEFEGPEEMAEPEDGVVEEGMEEVE
jgi:hypothetical protein